MGLLGLFDIAMGKYFTIDELCRSNTADKMGIRNVPSADIKERLEVLINELLDPVREAWGKPIKVNSGYRCPKLNKAVGGVANSQHMKGEAADLNAGSKWENEALFELIRKNYEFDQLIDESRFACVSKLNLNFIAAHIGKNFHQECGFEANGQVLTLVQAGDSFKGFGIESCVL